MPTDNRNVGFRHTIARWGVAGGVALFAVALGWMPASADAPPGPSCGEKTITNPNGVSVRVLFANNGWVQRFLVVTGADNPENANDTIKSLEKTYGQAGVNAPPLKVISFKSAGSDSGGMMIPDKAVDSCGRTLDFN